MSSEQSTTRKPRRRLAIAALALAVAGATAGVALVASGGAVGANFTSSAPVHGSANAGNLKAGVVGTLNYVNLIPGLSHAQTQTVTLTNDGDVPATTVTIGAPVTVDNWTLPNAGGQTPDFSQVVVTVADSNLAPNTPITQLPPTITLNGGVPAATDPNHPGTLNLTVTVGILDRAPAVNNLLQGASVTGSVTATLGTS